MDSVARFIQSVGRSLRNADRARWRAERARMIAETHERCLADASQASRSLHESAARVHRCTEDVQRSVAALYDRLAHELVTPASPAAVSAAATMFDAAVRRVPVGELAFLSVGRAQWGDLVFTSDETAGAVHDLELVFHEGPAHDCLRIGPIRVAGAGLSRRWSLYGPQLGPFGVGSLAAVPVCAGGTPLASLVVFGAAAGHVVETLSRLRGYGEATLNLALRELAAAHRTGPTGLSDPDGRAVVHQAAGALSAQQHCSVADAYALIHAHSFAEGISVDTIASRILDGQYVFEHET